MLHSSKLIETVGSVAFFSHTETDVFCLCSVDIEGTFEKKGIKDAKSKLSFVAAEVREAWPKEVKDANVDTLLMKHFLSGFDDKDAKIILKHISDIQKPKSHILLFQVPILVYSTQK